MGAVTPLRRLGLACLLVLGITLSNSARIIYVDDDASESGNGSSWASAHRYLQDALAVANAEPTRVEIRAAQGTYKPDQGAAVSPGDTEATFRIAGGVMLCGGYAGISSPNPNARDLELYQTVLSGDLANNDISVDDAWEYWSCHEGLPARADNSTRIATVTVAAGNVAVDGIVFAGAGGTDTSASALYVGRSAQVTVRNCTFTQNAAPGLRCEGLGLTVVDCTFSKNMTEHPGGGISVESGNPRISRCVFEDNVTATGGGGLHIEGGCFQITDCLFLRNAAGRLSCHDSGFGGGFYTLDGSDGSVVKNCIFIANVASSGGAANFGSVGLAPAGPLGRSGPILLTDCLFVGNQACEGGAMFAHAFTVDVEHSAFRCNFACSDSPGRAGGAMGNWRSVTRFGNCVFAGNTAAQAGAVIGAIGGGRSQWRDTEAWENFDVVLSNCTMVGNMAPVGRTVACWSTEAENRDTAIISNCILANRGLEIYNPDGSEVTIAYTNLRGGSATVHDPCNAVAWGGGNTDVDPLFAGPGHWDGLGTPDDPNDDIWADGDYHLMSRAGRWDSAGENWAFDDVTSPCIDAGDPNSLMGPEPFPNGGRINMGAYGGTAEASRSPSDEPISVLVYPDPNGRLVYGMYANCGDTRQLNTLPDWSRCGYLGGGVAIPDVPTAITIGPVAGDNTSNIQVAIDTVAQLPPDANGFRGAVLLERGVYSVEGTLRITASGIVLRGEGQSPDGTVIIDTGQTQDTLIEVEGGARTEFTNTRMRIADSFVPVGASSFRVTSGRGFDVGDRVIVHRQTNDKWIDDLDMRQYGWTASYYEDKWERVIIAREGDEITLDAPIVQAIDGQYGGGAVYKYAATNRISNVGIEDLWLESEYTFATDENHGWSAIALRNVEDAWVRRVTSRHFGYSCVSALSGAKNVTVEDCACLDPKSQITGGRRYSFYLDDCCFVLVQRCFAREGRHDFVTGSRVPGPNAFVDCLAIDCHADSGNHHRYAEGTLFDNVRADRLAVENREDSGSGHGWSGAQTMFWNCEASTVCHTPVGAMNWAIGVVGKQSSGSWAPREPLGWWESYNAHVWPRSLYYQQLADRLGPQAVANVTTSDQRSGTIWSQLLRWVGAS